MPFAMLETISKVVIPEYQSGRFPQIGRFGTKKTTNAERYIFTTSTDNLASGS